MFLRIFSCLFYWRNHNSFLLKLTKTFEQIFIIFYAGGVPYASEWTWLILIQG